MSAKLELETFAGKSMQAWKDQAAKAGLVLRAPNNSDSGDYPSQIYSSLRLFRRNISITKNHVKIVKTISRALVTVRDEKNKPVKKEYLWYTGYYSGITHKNEEYHANFEIGRYAKPRIVPNGRITYYQRTGDPIGPEKALAGSETVYEIEVPKSKEGRKKLIDSIIGDSNHPDNILYYVRHLNQNNYEQSRDEIKKN